MKSAFKIPKKKFTLTVNLEDGESLQGNIFLDLQSAYSSGAEYVVDFLNEKTPFFPLAVGEEAEIHLINKNRLIWVDTKLEKSEFGESFGKRMGVTLITAPGNKFTGELIIMQPEYQARVLDFFNESEKTFFEIITQQGVSYINRAYVSQVIPI